jgi:hypothetical protein
LNNLLEKIEEIPVFELADIYVGEGLKKQPHLRAVVEHGTSDAVAIVSDRYNLVQIRELFESAVACFPGEIDGDVLYYGGKGDLAVFPSGSRVGLLVQNSVDLSSAVRISFCTKVGGDGVFRIPAEVASPFVRVHTARDIQVQVDQYLALLESVRRAWEQIVHSLASLELSREDIETLKKDIGADKRLGRMIDEYLPDPSQETIAPVKFWDFVQVVLRAVQRRRYRTRFHLSRRIRRIGDAILRWAVYEKLRLSAQGVRP